MVLVVEYSKGHGARADVGFILCYHPPPQLGMLGKCCSAQNLVGAGASHNIPWVHCAGFMKRGVGLLSGPPPSLNPRS